LGQVGRVEIFFTGRGIILAVYIRGAYTYGMKHQTVSDGTDEPGLVLKAKKYVRSEQRKELLQIVREVKERGELQTTIAERLGVTQATVSRWLSLEHEVPPWAIAAMQHVVCLKTIW
jgi:hypothetical protein